MAAPVQATAKPMDEKTMRRLNRRPPKGNEGMGRTLDGLVSYTVEHFKREEQLFAKTGYSESAAHTTEHQNVCEQVHTVGRGSKYRRSGITTCRSACE
jgi:hemerythrin